MSVGAAPASLRMESSTPLRVKTMEIPAAATQVNLFAGFESRFIYSSNSTKFGQGIYTAWMSLVRRIQLQS